MTHFTFRAYVSMQRLSTTIAVTQKGRIINSCTVDYWTVLHTEVLTPLVIFMESMLTFYPSQRNEIISPCPLELQIHHHPTFYPQCLVRLCYRLQLHHGNHACKHIAPGRYHKGQSSERALGKSSVSRGKCVFQGIMERYTIH